MAENFQENVVYGQSALSVSGDAIVVGSTDAGAKSVIFNNSGSQGHLAWNPSGNHTINLPDANGTIQLTGQVPNAIYDGANSISTGTIRFTNANGVTFSINGQTISGSVAAQTVQTVGLYALGNTTQNSSTTLDARTLSFNGLGNISVGYSNGSIQISGAGGGGSVNLSAGTTSNNLTNFVFSNSNNVSFGLNGSTVTATISVPAQSAQTQNVVVPTAGTQTATSGTVVFSNSNGISFGMSNSSIITASFNGTLNSVVFSNANNITFGSAGNTTITASYSQSVQTQSNVQAIYDGANSISTGTIRFSNSNGVSFGINAQTITASHAINISASGGSNNLTAITFSNSNNVTFGLAGSVITASVGAFQSAFTRNMFYPFQEAVATVMQHSNGTLHIHPCPDAEGFAYDRMLFDLSVTYNTTGVVSGTISMWAGIYTRNVSTLSLVASSSTSLGMTMSSTNSSQSYFGAKIMSMGWTTTISKADIWIGILSSTSANVASASFQQFVVSDVATNHAGILGAATANSNQDVLGLGYFSTSTGGMPATIAFSNIFGTNSNALRPPLYRFLNGTA